MLLRTQHVFGDVPVSLPGGWQDPYSHNRYRLQHSINAGHLIQTHLRTKTKHYVVRVMIDESRGADVWSGILTTNTMGM